LVGLEADSQTSLNLERDALERDPLERMTRFE